MSIAPPSSFVTRGRFGTEGIVRAEDVTDLWQDHAANSNFLWATMQAAQGGVVPHGSEAPIARSSWTQRDHTQLVAVARGFLYLQPDRTEIRIWTRFEKAQGLRVAFTPVFGTAGSTSTYNHSPASSALAERADTHTLPTAGGAYRWILSMRAWDASNVAGVFAFRLRELQLTSL